MRLCRRRVVQLYEQRASLSRAFESKEKPKGASSTQSVSAKTRHQLGCIDSEVFGTLPRSTDLQSSYPGCGGPRLVISFIRPFISWPPISGWNSTRCLPLLFFLLFWRALRQPHPLGLGACLRPSLWLIEVRREPQTTDGRFSNTTIDAAVSASDMSKLGFYVQYASASYCNVGKPAGSPVSCSPAGCPDLEANGVKIVASFE